MAVNEHGWDDRQCTSCGKIHDYSVAACVNKQIEVLHKEAAVIEERLRLHRAIRELKKSVRHAERSSFDRGFNSALDMMTEEIGS